MENINAAKSGKVKRKRAKDSRSRNRDKLCLLGKRLIVRYVCVGGGGGGGGVRGLFRQISSN